MCGCSDHNISNSNCNNNNNNNSNKRTNMPESDMPQICIQDSQNVFPRWVLKKMCLLETAEYLTQTSRNSIPVTLFHICYIVSHLLHCFTFVALFHICYIVPCLLHCFTFVTLFHICYIVSHLLHCSILLYCSILLHHHVPHRSHFFHQIQKLPTHFLCLLMEIPR